MSETKAGKMMWDEFYLIEAFMDVEQWEYTKESSDKGYTNLKIPMFNGCIVLYSDGKWAYGE